MHILSGSGVEVPFAEKVYGTFIDNKNIYLVLVSSPLGWCSVRLLGCLWRGIGM